MHCWYQWYNIHVLTQWVLKKWLIFSGSLSYFLTANLCILIQISLKIVSMDYIDDKSSLSHPSLGWLYVFSSFPPPRPPPPPQWLLLLTSKPFELHLRYLGQRKYRSGKMYWMTIRSPWLKVTAVTLINKNLLVCRIKWEPLNQSIQNLVAISPWSWLSPD